MPPGVSRKGKEKVVAHSDTEFEEEVLTSERNGDVEWTDLPHELVIRLLSFLNFNDRASLASTSKRWRDLCASPSLWISLDLRGHKCDPAMASSLAPRCRNLQKLRFVGAESADAIIFLQARNLREISGDYCGKVTDATISVIAARHELLECLQLGPDLCERITSYAVKQIAFCCPKLTKLRLSGIRDVRGDAINALGNHCPHLTDVGFLDCLKVDELALGNVASLRFLSVAGTAHVEWDVVSNVWHKLPNLVGLDVSRTDVGPAVVSTLLISSHSLKVLCALNCPDLEGDANFTAPRIYGKSLLAHFTDIFEGIASLFADTTGRGRTVFQDWRNSNETHKRMDEMMTWFEGILSHSLLQSARSNPPGLEDFWLGQGAPLLFILMQSSQEDVQERAASGLAYLILTDDRFPLNRGRAEAVMRDRGIRILLDLAKSRREGLQLKAAKAIACLLANVDFAKAVAEEGGIDILTSLARSMNRLVAKEAAGGIWNLSLVEEHKGAIAEAGGVKALVDLIFKRSYDYRILECAAGALANLVSDDKCRMEVALADGVDALVMLAHNCEFEGVQKQVTRALANLASQQCRNGNNAAVGQQVGVMEALVRLTRSPHEVVGLNAADTLWNLSFDDRNREAIASAGGVDALVDLAKTCLNASPVQQLRVARALWGLAVSETNSSSIGLVGGVAPLIEMARSIDHDVRGAAVGAICNIVFVPINALSMVEQGGVPVLVQICSSSTSKTMRFLATLALAFMFDGSVDEQALVGTSSEGSSNRRMAFKLIEDYVLVFSDREDYTAAAASSAPAALAEVTGRYKCSEAKIKRFISMLEKPSELRAFAAFALLQFTIPGGCHTLHHVKLMQDAGAASVLHATIIDETAPGEAKKFARIVLRNLEHHQAESSKGI